MPLISGREILAFASHWSWSTTVPTLCAIFIVSRIFRYLGELRAVSHLPGLRCPFGPFGAVGAAFPKASWNPGLLYNWQRRFDLYRDFPTDTISIVSYITGTTQLVSANLDVAHQVLVAGHKGDWIKTLIASEYFSKWGPSLVSVDKEVWARHRRILTPAFSAETYQMVWEQTVAAYHDMVAYNDWSEKSVVDIPDIEAHTTKLAMLLITSCGFGIPSTWSSQSMVKDGSETMSIVEALRIDSQEALTLDLLPSWVMLIPMELTRKVKAAREVLNKYMNEEAASRRDEMRRQIALGEESGRDIFTLLARANELEAQSNKLALSDREIIGNVYFLLIAGHETASHTLTATLAHLALNQDLQEELYQHIINTVGLDGNPKYENYYKVDKVLATFYEGIRMCPAGYIVLREAGKDTALVIPGRDGERESIMHVRKGTMMTIDMVGMNYNPRYFADAHMFKPSRWFTNGESEGAEKADLVTSFGIGPRTCIGRRFATTEAVAFLTMLLRDWILEPLLLEGETLDQWKARLTDCRAFLSLGMKDVPVRLRRRKP